MGEREKHFVLYGPEIRLSLSQIWHSSSLTFSCEQGWPSGWGKGCCPGFWRILWILFGSVLYPTTARDTMDPQPHWHRLQVPQNTTQLLPLQWTQIYQIMITSWEFSSLLIHFQLIWKFFKSIITKPRVLSLNKIWNIQRMINEASYTST